MCTGNFHRMGFNMLHHLASANLQMVTLISFNCHPIEDVNQYIALIEGNELVSYC